MAGSEPDTEAAEREGESLGPRAKGMTIGAVCKALRTEFPDISISKIRYLEDQKLLSPRRTPGGYRLYSQSDVERLKTILRMQRDEFLPLRVIRQELAAGHDLDAPGERSRPGSGVRRAILVSSSGARLSLADVIDETGAREELVHELEEFGVIEPERRDGRSTYDETDREIVRSANELSRFGVAARNLRVFRSSADREANLLEAILGPALRSRNPQRHKE